MSKLDKPYLKLLKKVRGKGTFTSDRTSTGTLHLFGERIKYDISEQVPFLTTKKVWPKGVFEELCWFIRGETNAKILEDKGVNIWREWGDQETREMGPIYGYQWRKAYGKDQLFDLVRGILYNPYSRRHILMAWNPGDTDKMALPPCHCMSQYLVDGNKLHCILTQRSGDMFLGIPFNSASYTALTYFLAELTGLKPGTLTHNIGDAHIYVNHLDQVDLQLTREPRESPTLKVHLKEWQVEPDPRRQSAEDYGIKRELNNASADMFQLDNYFPDPGIKAPVAI